MSSLYKLGGAGFIASGVLFLARAFLEFAAGPPPSSGVDILDWRASNTLALSMISEVLFFAAMCLVPGVLALHRSLANHSSLAVTGCGIIGAAIPLLGILLVVHGRLVYPVYGLRVDSPELAEFVVSMFYGGWHAFLLLLAVATFLLSLAMMRGFYGKGIAFLGIATSAFDVVGSYPDAIGPTPTLVCAAFFAGWFVAIGMRLYRMAPGAACLPRRM
jgi:hypothetical protein